MVKYSSLSDRSPPPSFSAGHRPQQAHVLPFAGIVFDHRAAPGSVESPAATETIFQALAL